MTASCIASEFPPIIQGGMGVGVSNWRLARAVSLRGQIGVVSGTVLDTILVRRLQDGDRGGHVRRAMAAFPIPLVSADVLRRYFLPEGRKEGKPYKLLPMYKQVVSMARQQVTVLANFVEVYLAKEGHSGPIGINLLTKVQLPNLASLYGAMLAGVDYVLMGAGIPREIPAVLDAFAQHLPASVKFDVEGGASSDHQTLSLDPRNLDMDRTAPLKRPRFFPIVASNSLAATLAKKSSGRVDGFVVEGPTSGGHNAPPRGEMRLNDRGEPLYGERDVVDLARISELGIPFWVAGGAGSPEKLQEAIASGAAGVQVGTLFAYCDESGLTSAIKREVLARAVRREIDVVTDPRASPTGYPFKIVRWEGSDAESNARTRKCDLGYLRVAYRGTDGHIGYRCPAEPVDAYVKKGGAIEDTEGRRCLCNGLVANIGHPQLTAAGDDEPPLITSGDDLLNIGRFLGNRTAYTAGDVVDYLLGVPMPSSASCVRGSESQHG